MNGICDTHLHFYDARFPAAPTTVLHPPDASPADYEVVAGELGVERAVVVQPTTYGLDNRCQIEGAAATSLDTRLVVVIDEHTDQADVGAMHDDGARGARFHMLAGGAIGWESMAPVASIIAPYGWHIQLQLNGHELTLRLPELLALPTGLVVDHIGIFSPLIGSDHPSFAALLTLLETGRCWVKLSAPYAPTAAVADSYPDVDALVSTLVERHPDRLVWASNWPHPGMAGPPDSAALVRQRERWIPPKLRQQILVDNPAELYGFDD